MITLERFIAGSDLVHRRDPGSTTSPTEEVTIARRIRDANPSFFWSTLLLPARRRDAMRALYFFCWELRGIADGSTSRSLKLAQLADWRAQIGLLYAGQPQHFVTEALSYAVERFDLRWVDFLQLYLYCKQRSVAVIRIALRILGVAQADANQVAAALGRGMLLTGILRDLTQDARRHRLYLPRELLQTQGIFATMPSYVLAQPALPQVCNEVAEWAADWFADADDALEGRSRWRMGAATALLSGYRRLLRGLVVRGWKRPRQAGSPPGLVPTSNRHRTRSHRSLRLQRRSHHLQAATQQVACANAIHGRRASEILNPGVTNMTHRGFSHIGLSTLDLDKTREFYEGVLGFKTVVADTIKIEEGGHLRHLFFDVGHDQLIAFLEPNGVPDVPTEYDAGIDSGLGVPAGFYHFAFEAGSPAALAEKRDALRARGVKTTDIVDHGWAQSIYFKDPNGLSLEYCCAVRNLTEDDARMQRRFSIPRGALELDNRLGAKVPAAKSASGTREA